MSKCQNVKNIQNIKSVKKAKNKKDAKITFIVEMLKITRMPKMLVKCGRGEAKKARRGEENAKQVKFLFFKKTQH